jgi:hypothetical protein
MDQLKYCQFLKDNSTFKSTGFNLQQKLVCFVLVQIKLLLQLQANVHLEIMQ